MLRRTSLAAALMATSLFLGTVASADVPPPVGDPPAAGDSPGTGTMPPPPAPPGTVDPTPPATPPGPSLPPIPPPKDRPSNPQHPDPLVGNTPPPAWYDDMYGQIYDSSQSFSDVEEWAYSEYRRTHVVEIYKVYVYAAYMRTVLTQYYWGAYDQHGQPISYPWGYASRGDFNYGYNYWVRPVYYEFMRYVKEYYVRYSQSRYFDSRGYSSHMRGAVKQYHLLTRCNHGKKGRDAQAKDDTQAIPHELAAGVRVTEQDILGN